MKSNLAVGLLRTSTGATIFVEASWAAHTSDTDEFGIYLLGSKGGAELHVKDYAAADTLACFRHWTASRSDLDPACQSNHPLVRSPEIISFSRFDLQWHTDDAFGKRRPAQILRLIDAIYRSAEERRELSLEPATVTITG
ncbi:MAG: hypothetical protein R2839_02160 [Thermomicrobiales bacterium]